MDDYTGNTGGSNNSASRDPSEIDVYQHDLKRQLVGVDQQTFQRVKQAIQTVVQQQQGSTSLNGLLQVCSSFSAVSQSQSWNCI